MAREARARGGVAPVWAGRGQPGARPVLVARSNPITPVLRPGRSSAPLPNQTHTPPTPLASSEPSEEKR